GMRVKGTNKRDVSSKRGDKFLFLRRLWKYVRPQKRTLTIAIISIVIMAISYSASVSSVLPFLQVMLEKESVPAWVNRSIAERRLDARLAIFNRVDSQVRGRLAEFDHGARVLVKPRDKSPLHSAVWAGDLIIAADGQRKDAPQLFDFIASHPQQASAKLTIVSAGTLEQSTITVPL